MTDSPSRESAKIYQFPIRARAQKTGHETTARQLADLRVSHYARTDAGSGWYHDAAIREAEQNWR